MSAISSMHSMVMRVESMSIATSRKSASVRSASTKQASMPAAKAAVSTAALSSGVKSTPSQRSACACNAVVRAGRASWAMRASAAWSACGPWSTSFLDMVDSVFCVKRGVV
jgi:hypothetical protein